MKPFLFLVAFVVLDHTPSDFLFLRNQVMPLTSRFHSTYPQEFYSFKF